MVRLWDRTPYPYDLPKFLYPHLGADLHAEGPPAVLPLLVHYLPVLAIVMLLDRDTSEPFITYPGLLSQG